MAVCVNPVYLSEEKLTEVFGEFEWWFADAEACLRLKRQAGRILPLPEVNNIATRQAQIAYDRLSLRAYGTKGVLAGHDNCCGIVGAVDGSIRKSWLNAFPFQSVEPLYLRSPSVTVKPSMR